jgi:hypothetical protein
LLVDVFLEAHKGAPNEIILDLDATDDPVRGDQDGRFFHCYSNYYCYLPLYIFLRSSSVGKQVAARER